MHLFRTHNETDGGVAILEYALIVGVIALLSVSAVTLVGERTEATFTDVAEAVDTGSSSGDGGSVEAPSDGSGGESDDQGSDDENSDEQDQGDQNSDEESQDDPDDESGEENQDDSDEESEDDPDDSDENDSNENDSEDDEQDGSDDEGSDDSGDPGPDEDEGSEDENENEVSRPDPVVTRTDADFTWWNDTKHGGNGDWRASSEFRNDTDRHQYLELEVTKVDEKGRKTTTIVNSFYVPANGSATFSQWSNPLQIHKGKVTGVTEVQIDVISVTTSDQDWQPHTYEVDTPPISVDPPPIP